MNKVFLMGFVDMAPLFSDSGTVERSTFILRVPPEGMERQSAFVRVTSFGKAAQFVKKNITLGKKLMVTGRLSVSKSTEVISEEIVFVESLQNEKARVRDSN